LWVIVDDGSTDDTPAILKTYASQYDWIKIVSRLDRGSRSVGTGVVEAFEAGLEHVSWRNQDFICKLDMDLDLPPRYFERLIWEMQADPRLATVSGKAYYPGDGNDGADFEGPLVSERIADDVSVGASKFYRRTFYEELGGLAHGVMWDGIDCYRARMLGWRARSIEDPDLRFIHLRPMGSSDGSLLKGRERLGKGYWFLGASPLFVLASAVYRLLHPPKFRGSIATLRGYVGSALSRAPQYGDPEFRRYLRRYHRRMLLRGRAEALAFFEREGEKVWAEKCRTKDLNVHKSA
jgi:glycosyltransferase involved in cell wall biosynthesis